MLKLKVWHDVGSEKPSFLANVNSTFLDFHCNFFPTFDSVVSSLYFNFIACRNAFIFSRTLVLPYKDAIFNETPRHQKMISDFFLICTVSGHPGSMSFPVGSNNTFWRYFHGGFFSLFNFQLLHQDFPVLNGSIPG